MARGFQASEAGTLETWHAPGRHIYFLSRTVLSIDCLITVPKLKTHRKCGVSLAMKSAVGLARPHYAFRVVTLAQFSPATEVRFDHQMLVLANECTGFTEVGSLFLRPGKRQGGAGSLLARSRYLLIAGHREKFAPTVMAELRGWFDEQDNSPFWDGIAGKFFRIPFEQADQMITSTDGQFILDLAPRHPIYLELVDPKARAVIGEVHRHGGAALAMLEREGFSRSGLVDIFDGGPTVTAQREQIATVRDAQGLSVTVADALPDGSGEHLLATTALARFRATRAPALAADGPVVDRMAQLLLENDVSPKPGELRESLRQLERREHN